MTTKQPLSLDDIYKLILGNLKNEDASVQLEESKRIYSMWAEQGTYDTILGPPTYYSSPVKQAAKLAQLFPHPENVLVLDIAAGTGIVGGLLKQLGFKNLHALEPVKGFADDAEKKCIYDKIMVQLIGGGSTVSCPDDTYDAVVSCGAFGPGLVPTDVFHEIIRVVKPGGYWINNMRNSILWNVLEYRENFEPLAKKLEEEGKWRQESWEIYPNHTQGHDGVMMAFQVC